MTEPSTPNPDVSVILATYNRAEALRRTLCALCGLDTGGLSWQVVVADNHAAGSAREVCGAFADRLPIRYLLEPLRGKNRAIVAALAHYKADTTIYNRTVSRGEELADEFNRATGPVVARGRDALSGLRADIIINCTPMGMHQDVAGCPR